MKKTVSGLYLILDQKYTNKDIVSIAQEAVEAGTDVIQYREKTLSKKAAIAVGKRLRDLTYKSGVTFIVNDDPSLAIAVNADGVHLGQEDIPPDIARRILGEGKIIGVSTHSIAEVSAANNMDINYIAFGPVFHSNTKMVTAAHGIDVLKKIIASVSLPLIAIGGIRQENISDVIKAGAYGVAIISAVLSSSDIKKTVSELKRCISEAEQAYLP